MSFHIETRQEQVVTVVTVTGRLILGEPTTQLSSAVQKEIESGHANILLNLSGVDYIDSAGLGLLVQLAGVAGRKGGKLKLSGLTKRVNSVMQITRIHTVFEIFEHEPMAVTSFE